MENTKIIFFGDIMGKIGRKALAKIIPEWQKKYNPDILIANVENLAHGKGVTEKTLEELKDLGIDIMTSGNHVWRKEDANLLAAKNKYNLITPANDPRTPTGQGYLIYNHGDKKIGVINLLAQEGMTFLEGENVPEDNVKSPFLTADKIIKELNKKSVDTILVDFHSEYTSETRALGWYLDGKVSAVLSTHTHVPTGDAQILPNGSGYITDVGMVGAYESVLGIEKDTIIKRFLDQEKIVFKAPDKGKAEINAVYLEINNNNLTKKITLLREIVEIN